MSFRDILTNHKDYELPVSTEPPLKPLGELVMHLDLFTMAQTGRITGQLPASQSGSQSPSPRKISEEKGQLVSDTRTKH
jgi:hypothetical protein